MLISCFLSTFVGFRSAVSEKSKMSHPIKGHGGHLVFPIGTNNTKLGRGRWHLASCQVFFNSVQQSQRKSRKCLSRSEARTAILFIWSARKHKLGRRSWDLASSQILLNSVQRFQRRSRKSLQQSEARTAILVFWSARKTQSICYDIGRFWPGVQSSISLAQ